MGNRTALWLLLPVTGRAALSLRKLGVLPEPLLPSCCGAAAAMPRRGAGDSVQNPARGSSRRSVDACWCKGARERPRARCWPAAAQATSPFYIRYSKYCRPIRSIHSSLYDIRYEALIYNRTLAQIGADFS